MVLSRRVTVARPGLSFQLAGERLDVGAADGEQAQAAGAAPGGELAQVERVGLAGQPPCAARYPARASRSGSVKAGWIVARAVDGAVVVIGHLPAGLGPELGQRGLPAVKRKLNVSHPARSRYATTANCNSREMLHTAEYLPRHDGCPTMVTAFILPSSVGLPAALVPRVTRRIW